MTGQTAQDAMRRVCELVVAGDYVNAMAEVTPEALAQVMSLGAGMMNLTAPEGYEMKMLQDFDGEVSFEVCFYAQSQELHANVSLRQVEGTWKIASVTEVQLS
jgi:hypothetical protein